MPIYVGINGEAKLVTEAYIGNRNNQAIPLYLSNIIPKTHIPASFVYLTKNRGDSYSGGVINTNIYPNTYTKVILVFAASIQQYSLGLVYNSDYQEVKSIISNSSQLQDSSSYTDYCIGLNNSKSSSKLFIKSGSILSGGTSLNYITNFNEIPQNYYTVIVNKDSSKNCVIKHNDEEFQLIGNNTQSSYKSQPLQLLKFGYTPLIYCAIYKNLLTDITPTKEYLPCIRREDGKPGLYESVEGKFYIDTALAAGPAIEQYNLPSFD